MSSSLTGIGVSRGIAIGRAHKIHGDDLLVPQQVLDPAMADAECARYTSARQIAKMQLRAIRERIPGDTPRDIAAFIDTHLLMLDDRALSDAVTDRIREQSCNAEWAVQQQADHLVAVFEAMDDAYLRSRRDDVEHVVARIQRILLKGDKSLHVGKPDQPEPTIVVADDITPADVILLSQQGVAGFVTEYGGPLSHTAILARSLSIPAIVGVHDARKALNDGEVLLIDGQAGVVIGDPDAAQKTDFEQRQQAEQRFREMLAQLKDVPAVSKDGKKISLLCNIELPTDTAHTHGVGADGVGLYRTEFLYMNRTDMPDEEEQYTAYVNVIQAVSGPITIRTLDLGADKQVDSGRMAGPTPNNPALGLRAIRLCLKDETMFRVQLRALLRASAHGPVKIMLPMISNIEELQRARALIEVLKTELQSEGKRFDPQLAVGAMIEVPAAALSAPLLAQHADFFSLGTNDLIQYTLAIDRVDDEVNYLYDPLHPAVLRLIHLTIEAGEQAGIPVSMCGEMAGDTRYTLLLLALGLTEFSMHPSSVLEVKRIILEADVKHLRQLGRKLVASGNAVETAELLHRLRGEVARA